MLRGKAVRKSGGVAAGGSPIIVYAYEIMRQSHEVLLGGGRIGVFSGSLTRILDDCRALRPTVFAATPTFWNGLYAQFEGEVSRKRRQRAAAAAAAAAQKQREGEQESGETKTDGGVGDARRRVGDKEETRATEAATDAAAAAATAAAAAAEAVAAAAHDRGDMLAEWRERRILGNRVQALVSTGAPLTHRVYRWLFRVIGRTVVNGYGTTETGGLSSNGTISGAAEVRLLDCPQLGYTTADRPHPRGEILARTPKMVSGYFHRSRFDARHGTVEELMVKGVKGGVKGVKDVRDVNDVKGSRKKRNKRTERNGNGGRNGWSRGSRRDGTDTGGHGDDSDTSSGSDGGGEGVDDNDNDNDNDNEGDGDWVLVGGVRYFRTGDIGEMVGPGEVRVIDRCKSFFKLAQGMYVEEERLV